MQLPDLLGRAGVKSAPQDIGVRSTTLPDLLGRNKPKPDPWDEYLYNAPPESPSFFGTAKNMIGNFANIIGLGDEEEVGKAQLALMQARGQEDQAGAIVLENAKKMFSPEFWNRAIQSTGDAVVGAVTHPLDSAKKLGGALSELPMIALTLPNTVWAKTAGVDLMGESVRAIDPTERALAAQETVGNVLGLVAGVGVSKGLMQSGMKKALLNAGLTEAGEGTTGALLKFAASEPVLGQMGRKIVDDVAGAAIGGTVQGAVSSMGQDELITNTLLSGVAFAPLGVATGTLRGLWARATGDLDLIDSARMTALYKATKAQGEGLEVMRARLLQANSEKSISQVLADVENIATSDAPIQAIIRSSLQDNRVGTLRGLSIEDVNSVVELGRNGKIANTVFKREDGLYDVAFWKGDPFFEGRTVTPTELPEVRLEDRTISSTTSLDGRIKTITIEKGGKKIPLLQEGDVFTKAGSRKTAYDAQGNRVLMKRKPNEVIEQLKKEAVDRGQVFNPKDAWEPLPEGAVIRDEPYIIRAVTRLRKGQQPTWEIEGTYAADGTLLKKGGGTVNNVEGWQLEPRVKPEVTLNLTSAESDAAKLVFAKTGQLPEIGRLKDQVEFGSFRGQDFLVRRQTDGTYNLLDPQDKKVLMNVPQESLIVKQAANLEFVDSNRVWDSAFAQFQETVRKNPTDSFLDNLTKTAVKMGLEKDMKALQIEMARRYNTLLGEALDPWERAKFEAAQKEVGAILTEQEKTKPRFVIESEDLQDRFISTANSNGMYIQEMGNGYQIRSAYDDKVLFTGNSMADGIDFINRSGQDVSIPLDMDSKVPPSGIVPPNTINGGSSSGGGFNGFNQAVQATRKGTLDAWRRRYQVATRRATWYTARGEQITNFDETLGTKLGRIYERLQAENLKYKGAYDSAYRQESPLLDAIRKEFKTADAQEKLARVVEAVGVDEMTQPGGLVKGTTISEGEMKLAQFAAQNQVDMPRVLKYRRQLDNARVMALARQHAANVDATRQALEASGMQADPLVVQELARKRDIIIEKDPIYQQDLMALENKFNLNPAERQVYDGLVGITAGKLNEGSVFMITRYAMALQNPEVFGQSRAQLATKYGFTPKQMELVNKVDDFYNRRGAEFGIDSKSRRMINHYMNHIKTEGSIFDAEDVIRFIGATDNPNTLRAVFDMVRTGEIQDYSLDVVNNMGSYMRAGYKAKYLYKALGNENAGLKKALADEIANIKGVSNAAKYQKFVKEYMDDYIDGILGRRAVEDEFAEEGVTMALVNGLDIPEKELRGSIASDAISLFSSVTSSAIMGGRWGMGLRDTYDVIGKYFTIHGKDRAIQFGKIGLTPQNFDELVRTGKISRPSADAYYNPGEEYVKHTSKFMGKVISGAQKMNERLFKMTLQDKVYLRAQAAAYLEAEKFGGEVLTDLFNKKITPQEAMEKMNLSFFDDRVAKKLDSIFGVQGVQAAADYYARENAKLVVGMFGNMEQPKGWNTMTGRLMGSLGQYPMQTRRFVVNASTRGTPKEIRRRLARWAIYNAGTFATGRVMGFDMWRWMQTPASLLFFGGPALGLASDMQSLGQTYGADYSKRKYTLSRMQQYMPFDKDWTPQKSLFFPGSYAASDLMRGFKLLSEEDYVQGIGQLVGFPASKSNLLSPKMEDIIGIR